MTSCNVGKYLQPGEKVLRKNQVTVRMSDSSAVPPEVTEALSDVEKYYYQKPNKKILIFPLQMKPYCLPRPEDSSKLGKFLRANGEPPQYTTEMQRNEPPNKSPRCSRQKAASVPP